MQKISLEALARELRQTAGSNGSGRAADTVHGGHEKALRQTVVALVAGQALAEHENPGEATVLVLDWYGGGPLRRRVSTAGASHHHASP